MKSFLSGETAMDAPVSQMTRKVESFGRLARSLSGAMLAACRDAVGRRLTWSMGWLLELKNSGLEGLDGAGKAVQQVGVA